MIVDSKRRSSTVRANERRNDVINYLNKIITENRQNLARQSLNPLKIQKKIFRWMNDEILTPQCIENFLKHRHKEVVVIGIILPYQILKQCCEALVGQAVQILPLMLQACFLQKVELMNVTMMILLMEEDLHILESKADLPQKIIFNLATIWITSEQLAKKRIIDWELREEMFKKNNSLLVIKSHHPSLNQELTQRLQNLFWSVKSCAPDLIQKKVKVSTNNINRHAYQSLQQQQNEEFQFANIVSEVVKINLKRNWKYSRSVLCYPFLYYISCWMKEEQRDQKQLIEISLNWYFKNIEQQFIAFIKNFNIPIDQLYLRNSIATHKKTVFIDVRRHLSMFQNLFTLIDISSKYLQNLNRMFLQKQTDVYERNNKLAATQNLRKLQRIYEYRISRQFQQVFPNRKSEEAQKTDRNIKDFETDFRSLLQQYGEESIRVKSQLKTFNEFIMKKKLQYAEMLAKELRTNKKKYVNEAQELKDRLEIQMGVLHTLEEQIKELEDKKDKIDNENEQLKHAIQDLRVKRVKDIQSDAPSTGRKNQSKSQRKQAKLLTKKVNNHQQKQSKCCCQVM